MIQIAWKLSKIWYYFLENVSFNSSYFLGFFISKVRFALFCCKFPIIQFLNSLFSSSEDEYWWLMLTSLLISPGKGTVCFNLNFCKVWESGLKRTFSVEKVEAFLDLPHLVDESEFYFNSTRGFYCMNNGKGPGRPKCLNKVLSPNQQNYLKQARIKRISFVAPARPHRMCHG